MSRPKVVIVGAGFGGLWAAKALRNVEVDVTVVDQTNHHLFQPLLYQVATAGLSPADIAQPIRKILGHLKGFSVLMAKVVGVEKNSVLLEGGKTLPFDILILATGARHSYFANEGWEELAPGLKTLSDATTIRHRVLAAFERAELSNDLEERRKLLTFAVVGAGPTGVELAGAIGELSKQVFKQEFRKIKSELAHIALIEAGPRILPAFSERLSDKAEKDLRVLGVDVQTSTRVLSVDQGGVDTSSGRLDAQTVIWAAGVIGSPVASWLGIAPGPNGKVSVDPNFQVPGWENVYVIGDVAHAIGKSGRVLPGVSQAAMQAGTWVARRIDNQLKGRETRPFEYWDKGMMATIGKRKAVAQAFGLEFSGTVAWLLWLFVHVWYLLGFRNKLIVLIQWIWAYIASRPGVRLIISGHDSGSTSPKGLS